MSTGRCPGHRHPHLCRVGLTFLADREAALPLEVPPHLLRVEALVALRPRRADGRALARVEPARLDRVADGFSSRALSLLFPLTETLAVLGAMAIVVSAYVFFVRPGLMLSSYLLTYGFVLLRLLPLLNQLYGFQGHLLYLAGGIREVHQWLQTRGYTLIEAGINLLAVHSSDQTLADLLSAIQPAGQTAA